MSIYGPGGNSPGTNLNRLMDSMGFPDTMGDIYGASLDAAIGNNLGVARNLFDAFSPLSTRQLDRMMTGGFNPPGFCHRPHDHFAHHFHQHAHKHYQRENVQTFNTGNPAFEMQLWANPAMRAGVEQMMGGRVKFDGNPFDGKIEIARPNPHPCLPFHHHINHHCQNMLSRLFMPNAMNAVLGNLAQALGSMFGGGQAGGPGGAGQAGGPGGSQQAGGPGGSQQAGGAQGGSDASKILNDPNLSFEEKLFQFMLMFADKKQKEIEEKMKEMDAAKNANKAGGAGGGKKAGGAGGAGGAGKASPLQKVGNLVGDVMQMGGGLFGGLANGPLGAVAGALSGGGGGGQAGQAGGQGGQAGGAGGKKSEETLQAELQRLQQALTQVFTSITKMQEGYDGLVKGVAQSLGR